MRLLKNQPSGWFLSILSQAIAFDALTIGLPTDSSNYFLVAARTVLTGAATFVIAL